MLINRLGTLPTNANRNWQEWVSTLTSGYKCTTSTVTGFSPYFLIHGRCPKLLIISEYGVAQIDISGLSHENYTQKYKYNTKLPKRMTSKSLNVISNIMTGRSAVCLFPWGLGSEKS